LQASFSTGTTIPINAYNTTQFNANQAYMNTKSGQVKLGLEIFGAYVHPEIMWAKNKSGYERNGSRKGYGYFNLDKAAGDGSDVLDYSREKDGLYNATMGILPLTHLTYDVFNVCGQGTGGSFRSIRNDIGSVYDPTVKYSTGPGDDWGVELGYGNSVEAGFEDKQTSHYNQSGPWFDYKRKFIGPARTGFYEDVYFKEAGELTANNEGYLNGVGADTSVIKPEQLSTVPNIKPGSSTRVTRANYIYSLSAGDADTAALLDGKTITSYDDASGLSNYPNVSKTALKRVEPNTSNKLGRKAHHVTEIVQVQKDGRRYVYGLPTMNNVQREVTFAVDENKANWGTYSVGYQVGKDDSLHNGNGLDNFYSSSVTPSYVSAHLLTSVLSADYSDVTGDGISDDDLGTYTKFNYSRKSKDYRWRSPADSGKAQYIPGYMTDKLDGKASYLIGSREQWMLHSIETKNYVAEFYVSPRQDAKGICEKILSPSGQVYHDSLYTANGVVGSQYSYKLDSIVLYNKQDRFVNGANASAIKTVLFTYDYSLCKGVPNAEPGSGKLTLKKIQIKYGQSNLNLSAAYKFGYDSAYNYNYNAVAKDRWGTYKPNNAAFNNHEFPFTGQTSTTDNYAKAWSLSTVQLPSGGIIKVDYESDDYAFVQDKPAREMFMVAGFGDGTNYDDGSELYRTHKRPHLYLYFNRRKTSESPNLTFKQNYFDDSTLLYYNVPVSLVGGKFEPIKGYAEVKRIGACSDSLHGYIELEEQTIDGPFECHVNPITYTALNVGRHSLPQVMFKGADPDGSDLENIGGGLQEALKDVLTSFMNPIMTYMIENKAKHADLNKAFIRLQSPGLKKKGGGQRVRSIKFYDNWAAMAKGNEAVYGKNYDYTMKREDGSGFISSGVASWEPATGGDELPQRLPDPQPATLQNGTKFPPNAPIELYQELPIGESFYPAPVVGYRKVTATSIHRNEGRSSQSEDVHYFYTAKEFPIQANKTPIDHKQHSAFSLQDAIWENTATQGFSIVLNDMHGKPLNTEHWVYKPDSGTNVKELISYQKNDYLMQNGQMSNNIPVFSYSPAQGRLGIGSRKVGVETDITVDSRKKSEETNTSDLSFSFNYFQLGPYPVAIGFGYRWPYTTVVNTRIATVTKVTQQYGILSKVTNYNQGAITELKNEVFDEQTGNVLVTSVNNEFKDKQYSVNYPAHWAYKESGAAFENYNRVGKFDTFFIDTFGSYKNKFLNYNGGYMHSYTLPGKMPIGLAAVDQELATHKLGDELLLSLTAISQPVRAWVMGYTSDTSHCYIVLATRQPYETEGAWQKGHAPYSNVGYRVVRSGNRNRLGETIQSYTTTNTSNIFPYLKDTLLDVVSLSAQGNNHNLNQVYSANLSSDSLNPFVTGKVGMFRKQVEVVNLTNRSYVGGATRKAGLYKSASYWKTEKDEFASYCDGIKSTSTVYDSVHCALDSFKVLAACPVGNVYDTLGLYFVPRFAGTCDSQIITLEQYDVPAHSFHRYAFAPSATPIYLYHAYTGGPGDSALYSIHYTNGCCEETFYIDYNGGISPIAINRPTGYGNIDAWGTWYDAGGTISGGRGSSSTSVTALPYQVRRKILLAKVGRYANSDKENWVKTQHVTKYNWYGAELENKEEGVGYNAAVYGYNQQLPICVAKNARHSEVWFDGMEDYDVLQPKASIRDNYTKLIYSPIAAYLDTVTAFGPSYKRTILTSNSTGLVVSPATSHTGFYSLKTTSAVSIPLLGTANGMASGYSFKMDPGRKYVASLWTRTHESVSTNALNFGYGFGGSITIDTVFGSPSGALQTHSFVPKSNIIDGWQQFEVVFSVPSGYKNFKLNLPNYVYVDDIRVYPFESNMKGFVYQPVTRKLMASLDENNYATFYEYDQEGNLVRTKKETEQGILTVSESRSTHQKIN
jgi:hypothetical protein